MELGNSMSTTQGAPSLTAKSTTGARVKALVDRVKSRNEWARRGYSMPAPQQVKWAVLQRLGRPSDTWIETGTYLGDTTAFLAKRARHVFSIEPGPDLAERARSRFADNAKVTIVEGLSENELGNVLVGVEGPVSFWLDGHFSAGISHQGPTDTPVREELELIEQHLARLGKVRVLVDDVRLFDPSNPEFAAYPSRSWLAQWATRNNLDWTIEHDIFAAWN